MAARRVYNWVKGIDSLFQAAVVQLNSDSDWERNWLDAESLIRQAVGAGAAFVATPENTPFLGPHKEKVRRAESLDGATCRAFGALAEELGIHLLLGSFAERSDDPDRCYNTSVLFGPDGAMLAAYRKIHLFDVDVSPEVRFEESATVRAGSESVVARTELGGIGLSICYDLRFPALYQSLRNQGAELIMIPSAFTATTGRDHWHVLVRARAIETQCFVLAAAQQGRHDDEGLRESFGHSLIVDPWGTVLAEVEGGAGFAMAEIDLDRVVRVRGQIPVQEHARFEVALGPTPRPD
ncbi:MAG: carbon-nitrogen hydrolase family protein [marine benthic group bacterium]|nr:carbon-nitrogen hydrolase family protein [Gemmatimonadota bacterium]